MGHEGWRPRQASFVEVGDWIDVSSDGDMRSVACVVCSVFSDQEDPDYLFLVLMFPENGAMFTHRVRDTELLRWRGRG